MKKSEAGVVNDILLDAPYQDSRLRKNHNGLATLQDESVLKYGLGKGTSDLIGWTQIEITQEMVGKKVAIFTGIEVKKFPWNMPKKPDKHLRNQINWRNIILQFGGIAGFANSVEQYNQILKDYILWLKR